MIGCGQLRESGRDSRRGARERVHALASLPVYSVRDRLIADADADAWCVTATTDDPSREVLVRCLRLSGVLGLPVTVRGSHT